MTIETKEEQVNSKTSKAKRDTKALDGPKYGQTVETERNPRTRCMQNTDRVPKTPFPPLFQLFPPYSPGQGTMSHKHILVPTSAWGFTAATLGLMH